MGTAWGWGWIEILLGGVRSGGAILDSSSQERWADVRASGAHRVQGAGGALRAQVQPGPGVSWKEEAHRCPPGPGSVIHSDSSSGAVSA